jgi:tetratricopeptide (TPR) repeat protein
MNGRQAFSTCALAVAILSALAGAQESRPASGPAEPATASRPAGARKNQSLAVLAFKNLRENKESDWIGAGAAETLTTRLIGVPGLVLVERAQVKKVLDEQDLQKADLTDPKSAVKAGRVLGVGRIVVGTYFSEGGKITFNVRVLDVETAEALSAANLNGKDDDIGGLLLQLAEAVIKSFDKKVVIEDARPVVRDAAGEDRLALTAEQKESIRNIGTSSAEAFEAYSRAKAAFAAGDAQGVMGWLTKAIELDGKFAMALNDRATMHLMSQRPDLALADFNSAIQADPKNAMFWANRGALYGMANQMDKANKDFDKAVALNPNYPNTYALRGVLLSQRGQHDAAAKDFTRAIGIYPFHALYYARANCYYNQQKYDLAARDMDSAIAQAPAFAGYYLARSQAYYGQRQYAKAVADAKMCIQLGGQIPPQYMMMLNNAR